MPTIERPFYAEDENGVLRRWSPPPPLADDDVRKILMNLIAGMHLADHLGDVAGDVFEAARQAGLVTKEQAARFGDMLELGEFLARRYGATTVWGTSLVE